MKLSDPDGPWFGSKFSLGGFHNINNMQSLRYMFIFGVYILYIYIYHCKSVYTKEVSSMPTA